MNKQVFISSFPRAKQCASCRYFSSDATIEKLTDLYEDFVKDNICLFANSYASPCQYRSIRPPIDKGVVRHPPKFCQDNNLSF